MFKKKFDPFARADKALAVFEDSLNELREAVAGHHDVADAAYEQIDELTAVAIAHKVAASDHERRIDKIAEFLS